MCTLPSFPHNIDHCLTGLDPSSRVSSKSPAEANAYLAGTSTLRRRDPLAMPRRVRTREAAERLLTSRCATYEDCIAWARTRFQEAFYDKIAQLTFTFPEDAVTSTGSPFWSAPKRFPRVVNYASSDAAHLALMRAMANLKAEVHGLERPSWASDDAALSAAVDKVPVKEFKAKSGVKIETDPKATEAASTGQDDEAIIEDLLGKLEACARLRQGGRLPIEFEKDDDTNFHMDAIAGLSNMRARNYEIPEVDKLAKFIAGRIIPAIATTTAPPVCALEAGVQRRRSRRPQHLRQPKLPLFAMAEPIAPRSSSSRT